MSLSTIDLVGTSILISTDVFSQEILIFTSLLVKSLKEIVKVSTVLLFFNFLTSNIDENTILFSDQSLGTPQSSTSEYRIISQLSLLGIEKIE